MAQTAEPDTEAILEVLNDDTLELVLLAAARSSRRTAAAVALTCTRFLAALRRAAPAVTLLGAAEGASRAAAAVETGADEPFGAPRAHPSSSWQIATSLCLLDVCGHLPQPPLAR